MNVICEKLRESIINSAFQGKLTKTLLTDSPAKETVFQIKKEKEELIKSKKFKKINVGKFKSVEVSLDIPETWESIYVEDVLRIVSGKNLKSSEMKEGVIPVFGGNGITGYHNEANIHEKTIIIGRVGFYCGSIHISPEEAWVTDNAFIVTYLKGKINFEFLALILKSLKLGKNTSSTAQPVISGKNIYPLKIPFPPLEEQQRIVEKVDELMTKIDELEVIENQLNTLKKEFPGTMKESLLQAAMEGKLSKQNKEEKIIVHNCKINNNLDVPDNWKCVNHSDLFEIVGGSQPPKSKFINEPKEGYIQMYQTRDYGPNPIPVYIPIDTAKKKTIEGDILLARYGGSLGKVFKAKNGAYNVAMAKVIIKEKDLINKNYLFYYYQSPIYQNFCKKSTSGRSAQAGFNKDDISDLEFPLPPFKEQQRIVDVLDKLLPLCDDLTEERMEALLHA